VRRPLPSQFATFVAGELAEPHRIIEFGCGGGRDAIFFAAHGHDVIGVDASEQAVKACQALAEQVGEQASFLTARIEDPSLLGQLRVPPGPLAIYARFFVHAITDDEESAFLDLAAELTSPGDLLAVEYRTIRDASGSKVTDRHFRRFLAPSTFMARTLARGFDVAYAVEGFGFAKYKQDDAYVAREMFVKR
jgi:cyclopropane fatty-acyl-phospholipid synthase-like methyltransferase